MLLVLGHAVVVSYLTKKPIWFTSPFAFLFSPLLSGTVLLFSCMTRGSVFRKIQMLSDLVGRRLILRPQGLEVQPRDEL